MQYVGYDSMGVPQLWEGSYPIGRNVTGRVPVTNVRSNGVYTNIASLNAEANALLELAALHNVLLVGNQLISSGTGDDKAKQDPTTVISRPWVEPPEGSVPFDTQDVVPMGIVGTSLVITTLVVPSGYDGTITAYSWNNTGGGFVQGSGDLQVQILRNGAAIRNYDNILVEKGSIAQPRSISPLRIYSGQTITMVINHIANGLLTGNNIGCFQGYFYPAMS